MVDMTEPGRGVDGRVSTLAGLGRIEGNARSLTREGPGATEICTIGSQGLTDAQRQDGAYSRSAWSSERPNQPAARSCSARDQPASVSGTSKVWQALTWRVYGSQSRAV